MLTIDSYTANWNAACSHAQAPDVGALVRIAESADSRELDEFRRKLRYAGRDYVFVSWMPRKRCNVCRIVAQAYTRRAR